MNKEKHQLVTLSITFFMVLTMIMSVTTVNAEVNIRIIQGSAFLIGDEGGPFEQGTSIKLLVSDGQRKTTSTQEYDLENDLNFGVGFSSIDEGETVSFEINYQGIYQEPSIVEVNGVAVEEKYVLINSDEIYHVKLYINSEELNLTGPHLPNPSDMQEQVSIHTLLSWECDTPSIHDPWYDVFLSTNYSLTESDIIATNITSKQYDPDLLSYDTMYYWKIRVKDEFGTSEIGPTWKFTTKSNPAPNKPSNPVPADESINRPKNQQLQWTSTDLDEENVTYDVYFGTATNPAKKSSNQTSTSFDPGILEYNTTYYWKIIAWDEANQHAISPLWNFTVSTSNLKPHIPSNPQPQHQEENTELDVTLRWNGGDQDSSIVTYALYFGNSDPPELEKENLTTNLFELTNLSYNTTYYWKIISTDEENATQNGSIWSFTTKTKQSSGIPIADAGGPYTGLVGETITFDASASTDDNAITGYRWDFTNDNTWDTDWLPSATTDYEYNEPFTGTAKVMVRDEDNYNHTATATVQIETGNSPPRKLSVEGPTTGLSNTSIMINLSATDPDGDQLTYTIDWDDGSSETTRTADSDSTISETHTYTSPGWYTITVNVNDPSNAQRSEDLFIIITEKTNAATSTTSEDGGFPWLYIVILVIIIAIAGVLFYLYQNDQLPITKKQDSNSQNGLQSIKDFFSNTFQRNKKSTSNSMQQQVNQSHHSIPQPMKSSNQNSESKKTRIPNLLTGKHKSAEESKSIGKSADEGPNEFKRL